MPTYIADLHIHSRYSRATSRDCTPEYLDLWARKKGIHLLGTGDFTHPAWREELEAKLVPAEDGLYQLKEELRIQDPAAVTGLRPRFVLSGEISSIYKKNGRVRKVHNVILLPGLEAAQQLAHKLETIGNIHSDGRPILGLDSRDLLEITLEICPKAIFIPAHIWTPHFSMFGAFSGFDTVEECFEDLTPHIRAVETGLSSDPPMNWRLSALDNYNLVSNSDAHSPAKLGREANLLDIEMSYDGLYQAIQNGQGLNGTIEFFPEEGKYHFDGHRKCNLCLSPIQAEAYDGKCPVCGRKLTIGVSHRVEQLADRPEGFVLPGARRFESLVPLPEVIAASTGKSSASKLVQSLYQDLLGSLGPEFTILREMPVEDIRRAGGYLVSEGIRRLRDGLVIRHPGFDGEYGTIRLFTPSEIDNLDGQMSLFQEMEASGPETAVKEEISAPGEMAAAAAAEACAAAVSGEPDQMAEALGKGGPINGYRLNEVANAAVRQLNDAQTAAACQLNDAQTATVRQLNDAQTAAIRQLNDAQTASVRQLNDAQTAAVRQLNEAQAAAVQTVSRTAAVIAGPGTGKTGTLAARLAHLLQVRKVKPSEITAVTFTNKAAEEMRKRLTEEMGGKQSVRRIQIGTFHSICYSLLKNQGREFTLADESQMLEIAKEVIRDQGLKLRPGNLLRYISQRKNGGAEQEHPADQEFPADQEVPADQEFPADQEGPADQEHPADQTLPSPSQWEAAFAAYQAGLKHLQALDFDDLLTEALALSSAAGADLRPFQYLLVDEFQDINPVQYQLLMAWNRGGRELFVIGDPDQAIYGFRGSDARCFDRLLEEAPDTEVIHLTQNYRSTPQILSGALAVISRNPGEERKLLPTRDSGYPIRAVSAVSDMAEAIFVAKEINRLIGGIDMLDTQEGFACPEDRRPRSFAEIAVLYRTHRQADLLEKCLKKEGIPYVVAGRDDFFDADTVRGTVSFFRCLADPEDRLSQRLCLKLLWELGEDCIGDSVFQAMVEKYGPMFKKSRPQKLMAAWMKDMELDADPAMQKLASVALCYKNMPEMMTDLAFGRESDLKRCGGKTYTSDAVTLMTLHGAKGLEFPAVVLYGAAKGLIPLDTGNGPADMEEERRLFFVGMTRAREELILTVSREPSPFLADIPESDMIREHAGRPQGSDSGRQLSLFEFMK